MSAQDQIEAVREEEQALMQEMAHLALEASSIRQLIKMEQTKLEALEITFQQKQQRMGSLNEIKPHLEGAALEVAEANSKADKAEETTRTREAESVRLQRVIQNMQAGDVKNEETT